MTACSVLRCLEAASGSFVLSPHSGREVPVCSSHQEILNSGAPWMVNSDTDLKALREGTGSAEATILIGRDLPSHPRVTGIGLSPTLGNEVGLSVTITLDATDGQQQINFWLPEEQAKDFRSMIVRALPDDR